MAEEKKTTKQTYVWVEVLKNIKYGKEVYQKGQKIQLAPIHANMLAKDGYVKKSGD